MSRFTSQSVKIDADGILVDSLFRKDYIAWEALQSMDFSDEYVMVGRVGTVMPKQLQKSLKLQDKAGLELMINEPQTKMIKDEIALKFLQYAPVELRDTLKKVLDSW